MTIRAFFAFGVLVFSGSSQGATLLPLSGVPTATPAAVVVPPGERALWLRYPQISPDGAQIAFEYQGDIFVVSTLGGQAVAVTRGDAYEFAPVWSPDGKTLAFASDRFGNFDVFTVPAMGGAAKRLTFHSANEVPSGFTPDGKSVLFSAQRMDAASNAQFPSGVLPELYSVPVAGGRPVQVLTTPALNAHYDRAGTRLLYEDVKGYENAWRKHEQAAICRDVWLYDAKAGTQTMLSAFAGENRNPVFAPDEKGIYFLSEMRGSFNVWWRSLDGNSPPFAVTTFSENPVRFLSSSTDGTLCFGYDGEIYTLRPRTVPNKEHGFAKEGQPVMSVEETVGVPQKVPISLGLESGEPERVVEQKSDGATEMALSPNGKEIALVIRGDVFVASTEFGDTRRITETPEQERSVSFSPDGKKLLYAGERNGHWNLYETTRSRADEPYFFAASVLAEKEILANGQENFQPAYRPDGLEVAYLENRATLKVLELATGKTRVVMEPKWNYSYQDGDQFFEWAPDGKSLLVQFLNPLRWSSEVGLVQADGSGAGKEPVNLSLNGYEDDQPHWAMGGKMMTWFSSRNGLAGHGMGVHNQGDVYALSFTQAAYDRFNLGKSEFAVVKEAEEKAKKDDGDDKDAKDDGKKAKKKDKGDKADKAEKDKAKGDGKADKKDDKKAGDEEKPKLAKTLELNLQDVEDRTQRITPYSSDLADAALTPDGETLIYLSRVEGGYDLWSYNRREDEKKVLTKMPDAGDDDSREQNPIMLKLDAKGENAYVLNAGSIMKVDLKAGKGEPVKFRAELVTHPAAERAYYFEHAWRQMKEKLYTPEMNGVNWDAYKTVYAKFLPYITNGRDFAEMLSEMLGELNVSHTGSGYVHDAQDGDKTAALGVFFDQSYAGPGFKIAEVIEAGPLTKAGVKAKAGDIVEKIDGTPIAAGAEFDSLLNRRAGKPLLISVFDPAKNTRWDEVVKPVSLGEQNGLLYNRWVRSRRALVDKLSGGRLAYVHIAGMEDSEYRKVLGDAFGRGLGKEALIVDTRFNGGGSLTEELVDFLSGQKLFNWEPRGQDLGATPTMRWLLPSAVVMSESNYSDAHLFPTAYREMKIGPLIGTAVAGTGTAVWWETLPSGEIYFGIPEVGVRGTDGKLLENHQLEPDVKVSNDLTKAATGEDQQIEAAVRVLLEKLGPKK